MALAIGFVLFPKLTQLDLTGPFEVLCRLPGASTRLIAKTLEPVYSDNGFILTPTATFADSGPLDLICVPGGSGIPAAVLDEETVEFVGRQASGAQYVTSVCTGAFLLGAAGLLQGRRATTHWAYTDLLPLVGATYEKTRVVRDRNLFTGGGVTAGIDFGLTIAAEIAGAEVAQRIQLGIEYNPEPPFEAGHPDSAPASVTEAMTGYYLKRVADYREALERRLTL